MIEKYTKKAQRMIERWVGKQQTNQRKTFAEAPVMRRTSVLSPDSDSVYETGRHIPVLDQCDVLVVGGGPAGLSAALAAKRAGADTILMEKFGCFGGVITTVGMETIAWYRYEGTVDSEGIGIEMERRAQEMGAATKWPYNDSACLDADYFKIVADTLVTEAGIRPLLHCMAVDVIVNDGLIEGVITESKSGRQAIRAKRVIDCTGDADIAYLAGASYRKTPKDEMMGVSTIFSCSGVNKEAFINYVDNNPATYKDWSNTWQQETTGKEEDLRSPYLDKEFQKAKELGIIPNTIKSLGGSWSALTDAGEATNLNLVYMSGYDCTNVMDLTHAEMEGRKEALYAIIALKGVVPGFEKAKLRNFSMTLGCRDSRKIEGRYSLTGEDVRGQAKFPDSIGIFPEFIDGYNILILPTTGRYFEVPYGCLVPLNIDNLLVAGRCVAGDKVSHCAMRNMMACTVTGQGAGVAAAISLRNEVSTQNVPIALVQEELIIQKVRIH
jgi:ribulose 1,5-bisphosphate synthetase/thiazole synthase